MRNLSIIFCLCFSIANAQFDNKTHVVINPDGHMASIKALMFSPDGNLLYSVSDDKTVRVWNLQHNELIQTYRGFIENGPTGMLNAGAISPQGGYVAVSGYLGQGTADLGEIRYINTYTSEIDFVFTGHQSPVVALDIADDNSYLASGSTDGSIGLWSLENGSGMKLSGHDAEVYSVSFSPDGSKLVTASYDSSLLLWNITEMLATGEPSVIRIQEHSAEVRSVAFSPNNDYIVSVGYDNRIILYDAEGTFIKEIDNIPTDETTPGMGDLHTISFADDGKIIVVGTRQSNNVNTITYSIPDGKKLVEFKHHDNTVISSAFHGTSLVATAGGNKRDIYVWDARTGEIKNHFVGKGERTWKVASGPNGKIGIGTKARKMIRINDYGELNKVFDLSKMQYLGESSDFSEYKGEQTEYDGYTLRRSSEFKLYCFSEEKGEYYSIEMDPGSQGYINCYSFTPSGNIAVGSNFALTLYSMEGKMLRSFYGQQGDIYSLAFSEDGRYMYSGGGDQTVRIWDLQEEGEVELSYDEFMERLEANYGVDVIAGMKEEKGEVFFKELYENNYSPVVKPTSSLFISSDNEWIIWTKDNYYASSPRGSKYVGFQKTQGRDSSAKFYTFEQFDIKLNRPDLVLKHLGTGDSEIISLYERAYKKRLDKLGIDESTLLTSLSAPELKVKTPDQRVDRAYFGLNHTLSDFKHGITKEHVTVNGVPLWGTDGLVTPGEMAASIVTNIMHTNLEPGLNKIQIWGSNAEGVTSNRETRYIFFDTVDVKPNLYILGIGASNYKDKNYNLKYAAKDVRDFVNLYSNSSAYNEIIVDTLLNENVTVDNVNAAIERLNKSKVYDHVLIYIAGHGILDEDLNYYLAMHNMDFKKPESKGLNYNDLENAIGKLTARTRTVFIDACHSGEVDKDEYAFTETSVSEGKVSMSSPRGVYVSTTGLEESNVYELMNVLFSDLRVNSGATIIASAGGGEYALEGPQWNNGVFTYCVLNGIKSMEADLDENGEILLSELQKYVQAKVAELTGGQQKPTTRFENINNDYSFWLN